VISFGVDSDKKARARLWADAGDYAPFGRVISFGVDSDKKARARDDKEKQVKQPRDSHVGTAVCRRK